MRLLQQDYEMVFDGMLVKKSKIKFRRNGLLSFKDYLRIIALHYLGQRWSTVADASVDPRADDPLEFYLKKKIFILIDE
jgi:hypothetical protein